MSTAVATSLIAEQFPQWAHWAIRPVERSGWDNKTFRLGETLLIRLPSAQGYAAQVPKEQKWLPRLAPQLSFPIPEPIALGAPSKSYPWNWSVYRWIDADPAQSIQTDQLPRFASDLAQFLNELHRIDAQEGPAAGAHNYYRGASPAVYDNETRRAIIQLKSLIDADAASDLWEKALSSTWAHKPVWVHGDLSIDNLLIKEGRLCAVIDFGCMGTGDPACDLVIAWTFFTKSTRQIFKSQLDLGSDTWARARGWALWKALITLASSQNKASPQALKTQQIISELLIDHSLEASS
ncbi:MAG: hypothetical protein B7X06_03115 [Verrucomicrobia bacterium 21-51-4]|nr:MAG: hypothetical protein B7X06_03115 [Verrucomicrobia bacterium 21-51-4]